MNQTKFLLNDPLHCVRKHINYAVLLIVLLLPVFNLSGQENKAINELLREIEKSSHYDSIKTKRIIDLTQQLSALDSSALSERLNLNRALFQEYRIFKQDSAFKYGIKSLKTSPIILVSSFQLI